MEGREPRTRRGEQKAISASTFRGSEGEDGKKEGPLMDQSGHTEQLGESTGDFLRKLRQASWQ